MSDRPRAAAMSDRRGPLFWITAATGWAVVAWGVRGAFLHHIDTRPAELARFFIAGAVLHDLIFAPVVLAAGVVVARLVTGRARAPLQTALLICGCAALFAWPEVRDYARVNHNPSSLPHNYAANLLVVIGAAVVVTAVSFLILQRRRRKAG